MNLKKIVELNILKIKIKRLLFLIFSMNQQKVWDNIAEEWFRFKGKPSKEVIEFLKNKKGKILDLGSGAGRNLIKLKDKTTEWYLVDFSKEMLKFAEKKAKKLGIKAKFIQANLFDLPFHDNFFDAIIAIASLHCLKPENHEKAIKEIFRVLKSNSEAKIAVWNKNSKRFKNAEKEKFVAWRDKGKRYYYLFDEQEIYNLFKKQGFIIKEKSPHKINIDFTVKKIKKEKN